MGRLFEIILYILTMISTYLNATLQPSMSIKRLVVCFSGAFGSPAFGLYVLLLYASNAFFSLAVKRPLFTAALLGTRGGLTGTTIGCKNY